MLKVNKNSKGSVYALRKSRQDVYLKYADDGKCKDVGPPMIMLKDEEEEEDRIDSPFPTAFSPTGNKTSYSLDIQLDLDIPEDEEKKDTKSGIAELYAQVVPKSQRAKNNAESDKKDTTVSNGEITISVDPYSKYAQVPKSQRNKPAEETNGVPNGKPASNGDVRKSDNQKLKIEARSKVLSAIGSEPIVIQNGNNDTSYRHNVPTAQHIENALGSKMTYNESAEL